MISGRQRDRTRPGDGLCSDQLATGQKLRALTIVDTFSRFSPALVPQFTFRGSDVVEVLERKTLASGDPKFGLRATPRTLYRPTGQETAPQKRWPYC
jgi:hypothetical protein